jgi:hypothetical protein
MVKTHFDKSLKIKFLPKTFFNLKAIFLKHNSKQASLFCGIKMNLKVLRYAKRREIAFYDQNY